MSSTTDIDDASSVIFQDMQFRHPLRKYQHEILDLVKTKLANGERELHIVAPPGAGKTIIGLQIIAELKQHAVILSPNTTIQSQWGQKIELFAPLSTADAESTWAERLIGDHNDKPLKPITLLTYQILSTPSKEQEFLEQLAHKEWVKELTSGRSFSTGDAELRILELLQNNPAAHQKETSRHVSRLRKRLTEVLDLKEVLHANAMELLQALRRQGTKLIIFDECHHLTDYWAAIMIHLVKQLDDPTIIGLTGTPPEGKSVSQETRYLSLVGDIDYQVPTPALVKEGGLAPFQDLVYFTEPTESELTYLESQHREFHDLITELVKPIVKPKDESVGAGKEGKQREEGKEGEEQISEPSPLVAWVSGKVADATKGGFPKFAQENPELAAAYSRFLWKVHGKLPERTGASEGIRQSPLLEDWMRILEDFASHKLKLSADPKDHDFYEHIRSATRKLGYGMTEQGLRKQASPVDRVLAFSKSKPLAVAEILSVEYRCLQDRLRAVVVTDFESMSATHSKTLKGVLDDDAGGAVATMRCLLASPISEMVNPCLVTGSLLLTDKRITEQFVAEAEEYLKREGHPIKLVVDNEENSLFSKISAKSSSWESRLYVAMATAIFERGITKCLVGTRGLFGEGWDSQALNTLIDLTTTTAPVSVKQLRGRSIRIQASDPLGARKVANNWDVVCIAPELEKGLNDYDRFVRKHDGYFGICDDGQIECGVGHVHPSLSELTGADVFASSADFNAEMTSRALIRDQIYDLWKVGQPYSNRLLGCVELASLRRPEVTPPYLRVDMPYKEHAKQMRHTLQAVLLEHAGVGAAASILIGTLLLSSPFLGPAAILPIIVTAVLARNRYKSLFQRMQKDVCMSASQESALGDLAMAVLSALQKVKLVPPEVTRSDIKISLRSDKSYRVFLDNVEPRQSEYFTTAFHELMEPVSAQPYLIPKYEFPIPEPIEGGAPEEAEERRFLKQYMRGQALPKVASYHAVPKVLARSEKGRKAFEAAWNKYVSPGFIEATEKKPELLDRYFGMGPSLAQRMLWE